MNLIPYRDIILVKKSKSIMSNIISACLKQDYVHSEYVVDAWHTIGTDFRRPVSVKPFGYNIKEINIFRLNSIPTETQKDIIIEFLQKATKIKYDFFEAVSLGFNLNFRNNQEKYICITLITQALERADLLPKDTHLKYRGFDVFTESGNFTKL